MNINAYAAMKAKNLLEEFNYTPSGLGPRDLEVKITHCGICHSDVHLIDDDWGISAYPLVPGHEIVGTVTALGAEAGNFQIGQRVGIGWQRSACLTCEYCVRGEENLCPDNTATCVGHFGGFAESIRTDSRFVFPIPGELASENAAPLLCGGITVFSPLVHCAGHGPLRVGILGIGGLGHLAIQFARALGHRVTAFSTSPGKEKEALDLGAHHFIVTGGPAVFRGLASSFDLLLTTSPADLDWKVYLDLLRPGGKLCFVGVPSKPAVIPVFALIAGKKSVCGSPIGSRTDMSAMLSFAALNGIKAKTEVFAMSQVNEALDRVRHNRARYRIVLKN